MKNKQPQKTETACILQGHNNFQLNHWKTKKGRLLNT